MAETRDLKSLQCGFESHCSYQFANIAQMVEHTADNREVTGSIPVIRTTPAV